ncbi:hypothetical protein G5V59_12385 [Nocardioides sp. W3-2-3]|uniref:hypothetical protein n=1 Tax=Nocardioides convexus TaxID=2712224 RepID=UPI002418B005|nr:hypothetical protein [Nocardioides convexus]NHA00548.1 hypothetical protein [Nocardioides convexus]
MDLEGYVPPPHRSPRFHGWPDVEYDAALHLLDRRSSTSPAARSPRSTTSSLTLDLDGDLVPTGLLVGLPALLPRLGPRLGALLTRTHAQVYDAQADRSRPDVIDMGLVADVSSEPAPLRPARRSAASSRGGRAARREVAARHAAGHAGGRLARDRRRGAQPAARRTAGTDRRRPSPRGRCSHRRPRPAGCTARLRPPRPPRAVGPRAPGALAAPPRPGRGDGPGCAHRPLRRGACGSTARRLARPWPGSSRVPIPTSGRGATMPAKKHGPGIKNPDVYEEPA